MTGVFDPIGMTPDEFADGFLRHSANRAASRFLSSDLGELEDKLNELNSLLSALRLASDPLLTMNAANLSPEETMSRDGTLVLCSVLEGKMVECWAAYNLVWKQVSQSENSKG